MSTKPPGQSSPHRQGPSGRGRGGLRAPAGATARWALALGAVGIAVLAVHAPVLSTTALTFDDQQYLTENHLVQHPSWRSAGQFLAEILEPTTVEGYYQPLAMISLMLDYARGGRADHLRPFHATNLALHVLNTLLILVALQMLLGRLWVAALAALLFGVHPLTVEPVAWVGERKTTLAAFFTLASLIGYLLWVRRRRRAFYGASLGLLAAALLSKPTATPLPVLLLLLDYWPLRRLSWRAVLEKVPWFVLAAAAGAITLVSQARAGAVSLRYERAPGQVLLTVCHNIVFYLYKAVWPQDLSPHYPRPNPLSLAEPTVLAGVIGTALLIPLLLVSLRWTRALLTGWLFLFVGLLPTMGVVGFTLAIASDKYMYIPAFGLLMLVVAGLARLWPTMPALRSRPWRLALVCGVLVLAACASYATRRQLTHWQSTEGLNRYMIARAPQANLLYNDLGVELARLGRTDEALACYRRATASNPNAYVAHYNLGIELAKLGRLDEAIQHYEAAIRLNPKAYRVYNNLAAALRRLGRTEAAIRAYEAGLRVNPRAHLTHHNLALELAQVGRMREAVQHEQEALRLRPDYVPARLNLADALLAEGQFAEAQRHFEQALELDPHLAPAHNNLGGILAQRGETQRAAEHFRQAVRLQPDFVEAHVNLGASLYRLGRAEEAITCFRRAIELDPTFLGAYLNLALVLRSEGQQEEAIRVYEEALRVAPDDPRLRAALADARAPQAGAPVP